MPKRMKADGTAVDPTARNWIIGAVVVVIIAVGILWMTGIVTLPWDTATTTTPDTTTTTTTQ